MKKKHDLKKNPNQSKLNTDTTKELDPKLKKLPEDTILHLLEFLDINELSKFNRTNKESHKISNKLLTQRKILDTKEKLMDTKITIPDDKMISMCRFLLKNENKPLEVFEILENNIALERNKLINCLFFTPNEKRYKLYEHVLEKIFPIANCFTPKTAMSLSYGGYNEKYQALVSLCVFKLLAEKENLMELPEIKMLNEFSSKKSGLNIFSEKNKSIYFGKDELSLFIKQVSENLFSEAEQELKKAYGDAEKYIIKHNLKETPGPDLKKGCNIL